MTDLLSKKHRSELDLARAGVHITPTLINEALKEHWTKYAEWLASHVKAYVEFDKETPTWTEGALVQWVL